MDLIIIIWVLLFGYFVVKNIAQFIKNETSPVLTMPATVVDMRRKTHHHHSNGHHHHTHSYHITFALDSGEQLELKVKRYEYEALCMGDRGLLTHQGTRFKGFER